MSLNDEHSYSASSIRNGLVSGYTAGITGKCESLLESTLFELNLPLVFAFASRMY